MIKKGEGNGRIKGVTVIVVVVGLYYTYTVFRVSVLHCHHDGYAF